MRFGEEVERELHVPLGPLYLSRALEDAGLAVDFRDYQTVASDEPFEHGRVPRFSPRPGARDRALLHGEPAALHRAGHEGIAGAVSAAHAGPGRRGVQGSRGKDPQPLPLDRHHLPRRGRADCPRIAGDDPPRRRPGRRPRLVVPYGRPDRTHARPPADHRPRFDPLSGFRESGPRPLRGLRHDDQSRVPLSLHLLLGGAGLEPGELLSRRQEHRRRDGVSAPAGGGRPVPLPGRVFRFRQEAGYGVLPGAWLPGTGRAVEGLRPREPRGRRDDARHGRQRLRRAPLRDRVGLRPRAAGDQERLYRRPVAGGRSQSGGDLPAG